jgi:3-deoxy-7-phosphoheptulonate synthase
MNMEFRRKLPIPKEIKEQFPLSSDGEKSLRYRQNEIKKVLSGESARFALIIGPCSADREDAVLDYIYRLRGVEEKVKDKIIIIPRIYTNKPRTTGEGYKGMLHQPDPNAEPDMLKGILATRNIHMRAINETGFGCADEMLYPENHRYISDLTAYITIGARSVENQQHRLTASGLNIPVGMKNPTGGDISVMMNAIKAGQSGHTFLYRGWEVKTEGNPYSHAILRGYMDTQGRTHPNYHYENLIGISEAYKKYELKNPAVIVDTNHANSGKQYLMQIDIAKEVLKSRSSSPEIKSIVKGLMIESYIEDGAQQICDNSIYGKSVTDPCLGWEKTERLIYEIAEML